MSWSQSGWMMPSWERGGNAFRQGKHEPREKLEEREELKTTRAVG
jgi:phosphoenolpyruvate carboxylase